MTSLKAMSSLFNKLHELARKININSNPTGRAAPVGFKLT